MKILVSGSRGIADEMAVEGILREHFAYGDELIVGDARGVDRIAADLAERLFMKIHVFVPDWDKHGRAAGPIRNQEMVDQEPDRFVAIWDGKSSGTKGTIGMSLRAGIESHVYFLARQP